MCTCIDIKDIITTTLAVLGGAILLSQYYTSIVLTQAKNLDDLFKRFYENPEFIKIFSLLENIENNQSKEENIEILKTLSPEEKWRFLAYLESITIYTNNLLRINAKKVIMLYQWPFHHVFTNKKTYMYFWDNLVETTDENDKKKIIDSELNKSYWKPYRDFALKCKKQTEK